MLISFVYASEYSESLKNSPLFNAIVYHEYTHLKSLENEIKRLQSKNCDINWVKNDNNFKRTALSAVIARRHWDAIPDQARNKVSILLNHGASPNVDDQSQASLSLAVLTHVIKGKESIKVHYPDIAIIDMLCKAGADINGKPNNYSPLFYAVDRMIGKESLQALEYLLTHGAKTDVVFKPITNDCNLLSYMIQQSRNCHSLLFSQFSKSNAAQQRECLCKAIDLICKYGVKVDHKDNTKMTALDYAQKNGDFIVIEHLKKYASH